MEGLASGGLILVLASNSEANEALGRTFSRAQKHGAVRRRKVKVRRKVARLYRARHGLG